MNKELLKKYINYFGDKPPFPPKHIMESLVRIKDDGTFEERSLSVWMVCPVLQRASEFAWARLWLKISVRGFFFYRLFCFTFLKIFKLGIRSSP